MSKSTDTGTKPTGRQLRYLRVLAERTGTTFTPPRSKTAASSEINRLQALAKAGRDMTSPIDEHEHPAQPSYGTAVSQEELLGYGSSCRWREPARRHPWVPQRTRKELARYVVDGRERVLYGERVAGVARLADRPAHGSGYAYVVETDLASDGQCAVDALVEDYLREAAKLGGIPMRSSRVAAELSAQAD